MASGGLSSISAGVGHGRVRGGLDELRGEVQWVGARRIELRRRGFAGATSGGGFARCCSLELSSSCTEEEKGGLGRPGKLRGARERRRAATGRDCRRVDALAGDQRWYGRRGTVSSTGGALFARLNDFSPSLTS